jgi:phosphate transport system substrate-binding protein
MLGRSAAVLGLAIVAACGGGDAGGDASGAVSGSIEVDGSSTVFPVTEAMAEEYGIETGGSVRVTVGMSGTGGGFRRFCAGETDISNASRPITDAERDLCMQNGVEFMDIPVAIDGLAVSVNPSNDFVECLTVEELKRIWEPGSTIERWSQVRDGFPDRGLELYGPGTNSGTFDYFTEVIVGEAGASRPDFTASEDDNVLVQGIEGDADALGYFGYAYYIENRDRLKVLGVDGGAGCVQPTPEDVESGRYDPLARPLFIYVNRESLEEPALQAFVRFYLENAQELVPEVGYVPMEAAEYEASLSRLERATGAS